MGLTDQSINKQKFFERARDLPPATLDAIKRIMEVQLEESQVEVDFTNNEVDHSMLVRVGASPKTPAILKIESSGRLMLKTVHFKEPAVQEALAMLAERLGHAREPDWNKRQPTFLDGEWEHGVDSLVRVVKALARGEDAIAP